jgi:decaprenylphospho-beta-D-ribofuranose 2-oxidase
VRPKQTVVTSWGQSRSAEMSVYRPERAAQIAAAVRAAASSGTIATGDGRNYGDLGICDQGTAISMRRLDRIFAFDEEHGVVSVEAGVTFAELQAFAAPRGFASPVAPGTAFATLGGGVASDVHGKNHDLHGSLGQHLEWLDLILADGRQVRASHDELPDLFAATIGGCGLTGVIAAAGIRLLRQQSGAVETREWRVRNLEHFFELMSEHRGQATYTVGWIDALQKGANLGRGIFQAAEPIEATGKEAVPRALSVPFTFPGMTLNRYSVGLFNALYYRRVPADGRKRVVSDGAFHHPLDAIAHWNRLYGTGGFYQFQCVLPDASALQGIRRLLEEVSEAQAASFLGVLKSFGPEGIGYLSFPMPGVTLSLDIPARPASGELMRRLEAITLDHEGRIYLAKDATMSAEAFAKMYPKLAQFRTVLEAFDPDRVFDSDMARRLKIRPES